MEERTVSFSQTENTYLVMPEHINGYGRLFGGVLMRWIDEVAATVAQRHCRQLVTTASVDSLNFRHPAHSGDTVVLVGRMTHTGTTSMEVRVDTFVEELDGSRHDINDASLVLVAIDPEGNKMPVPGLRLETDEERREWAAGQRRYDLRKQRRRERF